MLILLAQLSLTNCLSAYFPEKVVVAKAGQSSTKFMQQSNLLMLLRLFSDDEMKRFGEFLASPYFNNSEKQIKFFKLLKSHHPEFLSNKLEKTVLYKALHGKDDYNDQTMRDLIAGMFRLAKTFIGTEQMQADDLKASELRREWMYKRNATKLFRTELDLAGKLLEKNKLRNKSYYYHFWLHEIHQLEEAMARNTGAEHKLLGSDYIINTINSLNRFYLLNFFELHICALATGQIFNQPADELPAKYIDLIAQNYINRGDLAIDIHYNSVNLLRTEDEKYFFELKERFLNANDSVEQGAVENAGITLENYCIKKIRLGDARFSREIIQIFRYEVEKGFCIRNGQMDYLFYGNVAGLGAESDQLDRVEEFVEKYKKKLPAEYREEICCYAKSHVLFARKKYHEALRTALISNTSHFFWHNILIKNLVARAQYELGMFDELEAELSTYNYRLKDEKVSELRRQHTQAFVNAMHSLADLTINFSKEKLNVLSNYIVTENLVPSRKWFLQKLEEIENKKRRN